jgi:hypothetical protein
MSKEKDELIELLENQIIDLTMMSKIIKLNELCYSIKIDSEYMLITY